VFCKEDDVVRVSTLRGKFRDCIGRNLSQIWLRLSFLFFPSFLEAVCMIGP
jgi:hypothetical protein